MIVPVDAGGQLTESNGVLLCRSCELASETIGKKTEGEQRLVNFWVSHELFESIRIGLEEYQTFSSMGALIRYLIGKYVEDERKFEDLELYQDRGTDSKLNVWVNRDEYARFKELLDSRGMSVTDAIRSLIRMWHEVESEKATPRRHAMDLIQEKQHVDADK